MKRRNALIALASCLLRPAIAAPEQSKGVLVGGIFVTGDNAFNPYLTQ